EEAVEVVEPPAVRPTIERTRRALLTVGRHVPLPEGRRGGAVLLEDAWQRRAITREDGGVAGVATGELTDRTEPDGVVVASSEQSRSRRRAERGDMEPVV